VHADEFAKVWFKLSRDYRTGLESALTPLTESQLVVLEFIMTHEQVKPSDLIEHLATTPAAVTTLLDRMVKNGLVARQRDEHDRRIVWIRLTDKGRAEGERGIEVRNRFLQQGLDVISRHNQKLLVYLLGKIEFPRGAAPQDQG
jgi:DNA-binding MarR family transcriptional regulator